MTTSASKVSMGKAQISTEALSSARLDRRPPVIEAKRLQESCQNPSLHLSPDSKPSLTKVPGNIRPMSKYRRSISHPFPSLFQSKEKCQDTSSTGLLDDTHPLGFRTPLMKNPARVADKDLLKGKCMTCNSTVRWPKELWVFRCTICMTINDLEPTAALRLLEDRPNGQSLASLSANYGTQSPSRVEPLSATRVAVLVEECIISFLLARLTDGKNMKGIEKSSILMSGRQENAGTKEIASRQKSLSFSKNLQPGCDSGKSMDTSNKTSTRRARSVERVGSGVHSTLRGLLPLRTKMDRVRWNDQLPSEKMESAYREGGTPAKVKYEGYRNIFKPLEEHIVMSFMSKECVNSSFIISRTSDDCRAANEGTRPIVGVSKDDLPYQSLGILTEIDAKIWTGERTLGRILSQSRLNGRHTSRETSSFGSEVLNPRSSKIDWEELTKWYQRIIYSSCGWMRHLSDVMECSGYDSLYALLSAEDIEEMDDEIREAQAHVQRILLKATESLLKRPAGPLKSPDDARFLLIILANPMLYPSYSPAGKAINGSRSGLRDNQKRFETVEISHPPEFNASPMDKNKGLGKHSGIIKRVLGLLSNLPNNCHHHLVTWFSKYPESQFQRTTELVGSFVTYRLSKQDGKRYGASQGSTTSLVPFSTVSGHRGSAALQTVLGGLERHSKQLESKARRVIYDDDWQIKAAARVMALLFSANSTSATRKIDPWLMISPESSGLTGEDRDCRHRQILPNSRFYNTLLDYSDLIADFEAWEARRGKFAFCQYPFFLSIWAKIQIMEYDARRQMEVKAREAFFDSIMTRRAVNQYLILKVRRECLVEDSLKGVSEVVSTGGEEIKKGLQIEFKGEEGIDAGGLRKEWFLLLVRDLFNPEHGMFIYDEDSQFCYFNPYSLENSDQFFLVGVVLGLAIYNSTILDIELPSFAFRKLLAADPPAALCTPSHANPIMTYGLEDLAELRPTLASGLQQLLDYDGDVEGTFCRDFVADVDFYGQNIQVPICPNGEKTQVTNNNRREFVNLYIRYLLDTAVAQQFEPFKRGFFTVCGGNALSLFRPEEIELLIRGSDEPLDIISLRAVAVYENWETQKPAETEPVIRWFWESFRKANPTDQRKLLSFITGSDRIPAMGTANLVIRLCCVGGDDSRFPVARTCFNMLSLLRYSSQSKLDTMLWRAVHESEGFGLK